MTLRVRDIVPPVQILAATQEATVIDDIAGRYEPHGGASR